MALPTSNIPIISKGRVGTPRDGALRDGRYAASSGRTGMKFLGANGFGRVPTMNTRRHKNKSRTRARVRARKAKAGQAGGLANVHEKACIPQDAVSKGACPSFVFIFSY